MTTPRRPVVNVDALAGALDRALAHPFVALLEQLVPNSVAQVRAARENLPEALSRLEARAVGRMGSELDELVSEALAPWTGRKDGHR